MSDPWSGINPSDHPGLDNVRRVEVEYPLDFRRGKDFRGRYIFVLDGKADSGSLPTPPRLGGIDISIDFSDSGDCRLILTLLDQNDVALFHVLCQDLLNTTAGLTRGDNSKGLRIVLERLIDWQDLLRRTRENLLTKQEIIGLFGELIFLRDEFLSALGPHAVSFWRGAFGDEQDFVYGQFIFEVKTQLSTADQRIKISSEAQLDTTSGKILLCHQTLGASSVNDLSSRSLNELVAEIRASLGPDTSAESLSLELALIKLGYAKRPEYDDDRWMLASRRMYRILDGFPSITPASLAEGIEKVTYQIRIEACQPFETSVNAAMEQIFAGRA